MLIHPPVAKPSEPPPGIPALLGSLDSDIPAIDANLQGLIYLIKHNPQDDGPQALRIWSQRNNNIMQLRNGSAFKSIDHYNRIISEIERVLASGHAAKVGLADYIDARANPISSTDLLAEAENPENNAFHDYYIDELLPEIERYAPAWIGLSINFISQALPAFALIGLVKSRWPHIKLIIGGGLITSWMALPSWNNPFGALVDMCIDGPGEERLAKNLGINPNNTNPPDYQQFPLQHYLSPMPVLPYATSRGCLWHRCRFCPETAENNSYTALPFAQIRDELNILTNYHNPGMIHFVDSALSPRLAADLSKNPPGTPWYGYFRFEQVLKDLDFCLELKKSGCIMVKLGLESGSQNVLDAMDKGICIEKAGIILNNLHKAGIATFVYLLFGTPVENDSDAMLTLKFVRKHHHAITFINSAIFLMPHHSPWKKTVECIPFSHGDLSLYTNFEHPLGWDRKKVRHFLDRIWKRDPAVAAILRRTPKVFTSNHAPFFVLN
ncbi:radical SAM protein [bacterium]|nr:radical SAM protein [bacterium]